MNNHEIIMIEDGMTGEILQSFDTTFIKDLNVIEFYIIELFKINNDTKKHNLIIKYGYKPM